MRVGISIFEETPIELIKKIIDWYPDITFEYSYDLLKRLENIERNKLLSLTNSGNAKRNSMHGPMDVDLSSMDESKRKYGIQECINTVQYGKELHCNYIVLHTNAKDQIEESEKEKHIENVIMSITEILHFARLHNVEIAVENVGFWNLTNLVFDQESYLDLFNHLPAAKALIDTGHALINRWDVCEVLRKLDGKIIGMHLHDNDGFHDSHQRIKTGIFEWNKFFHCYRNMLHKPLLTLEYMSLSELSPLDIIKDIENNIIQKLEYEFF